MSTRDGVIFQSTDLIQRRVEFVTAARNGGARLRDKDGMSLLMLPERRVAVLEQLATWGSAHLRLEVMARRETAPTVSELGDLAWLRGFDLEDLREFVDDLHQSLLAAFADESTEALDEVIAAWRTTARQLEDPLRRSVLLGAHAPDDFVEAERPNERD